MGIPENIAARKAGEEIRDLAADMSLDHPQEQFWGPIVEGIPKQFLPAIPSSRVTPMSEEEAIRFERTIVTFGNYANKTVSDAPLSYLFRINEPDDFHRNLSRYLLSDRVRRKQESEVENE